MWFGCPDTPPSSNVNTCEQYSKGETQRRARQHRARCSDLLDALVGDGACDELRDVHGVPALLQPVAQARRIDALDAARRYAQDGRRGQQLAAPRSAESVGIA